MNPNDSNGELLETPSDSQSGMITADEGGQVNREGAEPSTEEVAFNSLKGSTQERIRNLAQRANEATQLRAEMEQLKAEMEATRLRSMMPAPQQNPDVRDAVSKLDQFGVATKDYVANEIERGVNQKLSGLVWKMEMDRLEGKHNGSDGLPAFSRDEYEAFINANSKYRSYDPEDVYQKMYEEEIMDTRLKSAGQRPQVRQGSPTLRATRTRVQEESMTPEYIEQRLSQPDGRQWYEQNKDRINAVVAKIPSTE